MREVTSGVWQIPLAPRNAVNAYLAGERLIDAGTSRLGSKLPQRLSGHRVSAHVLTHAHPDHAGGSKAVCVLTSDPQRNEASIRRLAGLHPRIALFGHGPPLFDAEAKLTAFVDNV